MGVSNQSLRGLVGQGMNGRRPQFEGFTYQYPSGSYVFRAPMAGYWKFVLWGPGGQGTFSSNGGSGAYVEYTQFLGASEEVSIAVGAPAPTSNTSATFANGRTVIAGRGSPGVGGTATGGDVNINGSAPGVAGGGTGGGAPGTNGGGAGAPGQLPFRGGDGGATTGHQEGGSPGAGGMFNSGIYDGGSGLALVYLLRS
jgi:hypothetical protein